MFKDNGYQFAIVRVYESNGKIDPNGAQSIINAKNGGIQYVDGYVYPCVQCGNPASQVCKFVFHHQHIYFSSRFRFWIQ